MTEVQMKKVALLVNDLVNELDGVTPETIASLANQTVGLHDTSKFNLKVEILSKQELKDARRELISAIAAEKWVDGFIAAIQVMQFVGAI